MAVSPEVNREIIGETYKGLDPRRFVNEANIPFDVVKLQCKSNQRTKVLLIDFNFVCLLE